jgi:hypothetical protein
LENHLSRTVARNREAAHRKVEGQTIIILPRLEEVVVLNETGAAIWELSDGERTAEQVADEIARLFDVPIDTARSDVRDLYDDLIATGVAQTAT